MFYSRGIWHGTTPIAACVDGGNSKAEITGYWSFTEVPSHPACPVLIDLYQSKTSVPFIRFLQVKGCKSFLKPFKVHPYLSVWAYAT